MREIKFRMWYDNRMLYMNNMFHCYGQLGFSNEHYVDLGAYDKEECELMQYAGLKDKNGKEIYEGDIVKLISFIVNDNLEYDEFIVPVIFDEGCFQAKGSGLLAHCIGPNKLEVIGNIYENKELL